MRLLLTSLGLTTEKLQEAIKKLLVKPIEQNKVKIIAIDTVSQLYQELLKREIQRLIETGFPQENISIHDLSKDDPLNIKDMDVIEMFGGNNFHYLKRLRETGLTEGIRGFIDGGGVYVGVSAGSMIMGPDVDENLTFDVNDVGLKDLSGFGYVDFYILPHWDWRDNRWKALRHVWITGKHMVPLTDRQGILVYDHDCEII